jgi:tetratricopeptide (TPR) repeat protein
LFSHFSGQREPTAGCAAMDVPSADPARQESNLEALKLTKIAISLDASFARAYAFAANSFGAKKAWWMADSVQDRAETRQLVERAIQLDNDDPLVLAWSGQAYSYVLAEPETGAALLARAIAIDPNLAIARNWEGWAHVYLGNTDTAIEQFSAAIRLSPLDPRAFLSQAGMGYAHFFAGRYEEGISWATSAIQGRASFPGAQRALMVGASRMRAALARPPCKPTLHCAFPASGIGHRCVGSKMSRNWGEHIEWPACRNNRHWWLAALGNACRRHDVIVQVYCPTCQMS